MHPLKCQHCGIIFLRSNKNRLFCSKVCANRAHIRAIHNMHDKRQYRIWQKIWQRCRNPKTKFFHLYGGRGITVCNEWRTFAGFWKDMGSTYQDGLEIDRIDVNGNYESNNCRWVTRAQNTHNSRGQPYKSSKYKGVRWEKKRHIWVAGIGYNGHSYFLGRYHNEEDAAIVYNVAAQILWKEYAYLNPV